MRQSLERVPTRAEIDQINLERLVALNAERAAEEKRGIIHWLRPEYQARGQKPEARSQKEMALPEGKTKPKAPKTPQSALRAPKLNWPKTLADRVKAIDTAPHAAAGPVTGAQIAKQFLRAKVEDVEAILETLCTMGHAHHDKKASTYHR